MLIIQNARLLGPLTEGYDGQFADLWIEDGVIREIRPEGWNPGCSGTVAANGCGIPEGAQIIDAAHYTVMPGLIGHDFGDAIRFAANFVEEDCPVPSKAGVNLEVFRSFTQGFLSKTAKTMTDTEADTLALSCFVLTAELATRFLADYLDGDLYFKINAPDHNLVRTRTQIALCRDMIAQLEKMDAIIHRFVKS